MLPSHSFLVTYRNAAYDVLACADTPYTAIIAISSMTTRFPSPRSARSRGERSFIKKEKGEWERKGRVRGEEDALDTIERVVISWRPYLFFAFSTIPPRIFQIGNRALGRNSQRRISQSTFGSSWKRFYRIELSPHSVLELISKKNTFECSEMLAVADGWHRIIHIKKK